MSDEQQNNNFVIIFLITSSLTTIVTLIFHPRSAAATRKILCKTSQALPDMMKDLSSTLQIHTRNLSFSTAKKYQQTLQRLQVAIKAGIEASKKQANSDN